MIAGTRESIENVNEECIQFLMSYLRQELSSDAIKNGIADDMLNTLINKAYDWSLRNNHDKDMTSADYDSIAREALNRYKNNWSNKKQGVDDRGHRFGKAQ